jgi:hypothetical protein
VSTVVVNRSSFEGSTAAVHNNDADFTVAIGASSLDGATTVDGLGTWNCVASYLLSGAAFVALDAGCQVP